MVVMAYSFTHQRSSYMPVRMPPDLNSTRSPPNFFQRHVCSPIPVVPSRVRVSESVRGFRRRSSQLEQLLLNCSNPRQWRGADGGVQVDQFFEPPIGSLPRLREPHDTADHAGVHPCRPFSIMSITRNCAQQQMRARGETGVRRREAAPAPVFRT